MKYYGGRKISQEDLERALVVGMSPHERRRAAKKKGLSFKHVVTANELGNSGNGTSSTPENDLDTINDVDNRNGTSSTPEDCLETNLVDSTHELRSEMGSNEPKNIGNGTSSDHEDDLNAHMGDSSLAVERGTSCNSGRNSPTHFTAKVYLEGSITNSISTNSDKLIPGTCLESEVSSECNGTLDGTASECNGTLNGTASSKSASKMSLLGHGPHGNQVVNHLLKEYGDDGIQEFCKRWRQVFVDAIKPRFLPAGWDVTHRYDDTWLSIFFYVY